LKLFQALEQKFGYLEGDINWEGIQNVALNLRGQQLFIDYYTNPDLAKKLLDTVANTIIQFLEFMNSKTGTTSISVNRIVQKVDSRIHLHSNCTVTMISADTYRDFLLPYDQMLSEKFQPCGIHYCGNDMHKMRNEFAKLEKVSFFDVGWGSDVKLCREALPDKFFSLRLSPERMKSKSAEEIEKDIEDLLQYATPLHKVGLCCINMDYGTPDENVRKIFEVAKRYRNTI
jgi:uroporphyrinogen-III decarboxylase